MQHKRCTQCHKIKSLSEFSRQRHGACGRKSECKACQVITNREYRQLSRHSRKDNKCWKCGKELSPQRFRSENKRMVKEGFGAKLPCCENCQFTT